MSLCPKQKAALYPNGNPHRRHPRWVFRCAVIGGISAATMTVAVGLFRPEPAPPPMEPVPIMDAPPTVITVPKQDGSPALLRR